MIGQKMKSQSQSLTNHRPEYQNLTFGRFEHGPGSEYDYCDINREQTKNNP